MKDTDREENPDRREDYVRQWKSLKVDIRAGILREKCLDTHQPNTLTKRVGKCVQHVYSWGDPFCESVVAILGFAKHRNLVSKDGEDGLGGVTGFEAGKERM
jgi:hypothetical protein